MYNSILTKVKVGDTLITTIGPPTSVKELRSLGITDKHREELIVYDTESAQYAFRPIFKYFEMLTFYHRCHHQQRKRCYYTDVETLAGLLKRITKDDIGTFHRMFKVHISRLKNPSLFMDARTPFIISAVEGAERCYRIFCEIKKAEEDKLQLKIKEDKLQLKVKRKKKKTTTTTTSIKNDFFL